MNGLSPQSAFTASEYLNEYFLSVNDEYYDLYSFWNQTLKQLPPISTALEVGVGPTLYSSICLAPFCEQIDLADYTESALQEIRKWLDTHDKAFDWSQHIRMVLDVEGGETQGDFSIKNRESLMRKRIKNLYRCDINKNHPIDDLCIQYDLVTAHYCTEAATSSYHEWEQAIHNLLSLVKHGGYFMASVCSNLSRFRQYADRKPLSSAIEISEQTLNNFCASPHINEQSLIVRTIDAPEGHPYSHTVLFLFQKR